MTFELVRLPVVGASHRCGWPAVQAELRKFHVERADILLDDFVERTFTYGDESVAHTRPWVGIFHHTPNMPSWVPPNAAPQVYWRLPQFQASLKHLKLIVVLSDYAAAWYSRQTDIPVVVMRYALPELPVRWNSDMLQFAEVWQFGWYLRNTQLIHQINTRRERFYVTEHDGAAGQYVRDVEELWRKRGTRPHVPGAQESYRLNNYEYDEVLRHHLIAAEYFDVSASTLALECIATGTPLVVNYHPALAEYLGADYPLFVHEPVGFTAALDNDTLLCRGNNYLTNWRQTSDLPTASEFALELAGICAHLGESHA